MTTIRDVRNAYDVRNSRGDTLTSIPERELDTTSTGLVLHGRGRSYYGSQRDQNLVYLLENFANSSAPANPLDGQLWWDTALEILMVYDEVVGWRSVVPPSSGIGFSIVAGDGLTGGGLPTGSPLAVVIDVGAGTGIKFGSPGEYTVETDDSAIDHDGLSGFVANEHIDHTAVLIEAGWGLTGGGDISSNLTFNVVAGGSLPGLIINANDIAINTSTRLTTTGAAVNGIGLKTFTQQLRGDATASAAFPAWGFNGDSDTGVYRQSSNFLNFTTGANQRFRIESNGVLRSLNPTYETLVTDNNDIPNKKYVDDAASVSANPTAETFVGTNSISGLDPNETYLVNVYGVIPTKGTTFFTLSAITLRRGAVFPGSGTFVAATPQQVIDWPDGSAPTEAQFIAEMNGDTTLNCVINDASTGGGQVNSVLMTAVKLTEFVPPGSPSAAGTITLASTSGNQTCRGQVIFPSPFDALASFRITSTFGSPNGLAQSACGSTAALLTYTDIGGDWLLSGDPTAFEVRVQTVSISGSGLTTFGTLNTWIDLGSSSVVTWSLNKDGNNIGLGDWTISVEIRQKSDPTITTGPVNFTLRTEVII